MFVADVRSAEGERLIVRSNKILSAFLVLEQQALIYERLKGL
jgi:hypothetical protein